MWLPEKVYESLPAFYVTLGALFLAGALYVGIDHWIMAGYLAVGVFCFSLGVAVGSVRRRARRGVEAKAPRSRDQLFV